MYSNVEWSFTTGACRVAQVQEVNAQLQREREAEVKTQQAARSSENTNAGSGGSKGWNEEDLQLLIKAVNLFPAGTNARLDPALSNTHTRDHQCSLSVLQLGSVLFCRWEVIANYMNLHSGSGIKRTAKDVINKAKTLQKLGEFRVDDVTV